LRGLIDVIALGLPAALSLARRAGTLNPGPDLAYNFNRFIRAHGDL